MGQGEGRQQWTWRHASTAFRLLKPLLLRFFNVDQRNGVGSGSGILTRENMNQGHGFTGAFSRAGQKYDVSEFAGFDPTVVGGKDVHWEGKVYSYGYSRKEKGRPISMLQAV